MVTVPLVLISAVLTPSGIHEPPIVLALAVPYVSFEFFAGISILVRGAKLTLKRCNQQSEGNESCESDYLYKIWPAGSATKKGSKQTYSQAR